MTVFTGQLFLFIVIVFSWALIGAMVFIFLFMIGHISHKEYRAVGLRKSFSEFIPTYENKIDWSTVILISLFWPLALFFGFLAMMCVDDDSGDYAMGP